MAAGLLQQCASGGFVHFEPTRRERVPMASATSSSSSASAEALGVPVHTGERRKPRYERRILVTGGAGFMCVLAQSDQR